MGILLYDKVSSSCCRAVRLALEALDLEYKSHMLDTPNGENFSEYYLKMNPQHTYPVLDDDGFIISDSHAINIYLVTKYAQDDRLYPSCPKKRAIVNHRLFFEASVLFPCVKRIFKTIAKDRLKEADPKEVAIVKEAYGFVEKFLIQSATKYIAGDEITLADFSYIPTLSNLSVLVPEVPQDAYPHLIAYVKRCEQTVKGFDKINRVGHEAVIKVLKEGYFKK